ncbi:MAG: hypothetical protein E7299_02940 [Lachnospiraceae bacterium]|nr:hypothetical protein [Lachnospiraceae bacterium]
MKEYFNMGILPTEFLNETFDQMLSSRKGTIRESFERSVTQVLDEYEQELYECSYLLEGYINEVVRETDSTKNFYFNSVIKEAGKRCLRDCLHDNIYSFMENYIYQMLFHKRVDDETLATFHMREALYYADEETTFEEIRARVERLLLSIC